MQASDLGWGGGEGGDGGLGGGLQEVTQERHRDSRAKARHHTRTCYRRGVFPQVAQNSGLL
jgi:hypothetical protein